MNKSNKLTFLLFTIKIPNILYWIRIEYQEFHPLNIFQLVLRSRNLPEIFGTTIFSLPVLYELNSILKR